MIVPLPFQCEEQIVQWDVIFTPINITELTDEVGAVHDGNHIPPHGPKGAGSKGSVASPEWQVVNRAKRKWASVWRPIANNAMGLEAMTTDPMYTMEVYKSVAVNETSVTGNEDSSEELKAMGGSHQQLITLLIQCMEDPSQE